MTIQNLRTEREACGLIVAFAGDFEPVGWVTCDGRLLPIRDHLSLFALLGTLYGGDGRTTFGIPDLRGRVPMGEGSGPGLTPRRLGEKTGAESVVWTSRSCRHTAMN